MRAELQRKIIPLFHYSLNPASYLVLGSSESIGECQDIFNTIEKKWKIYRKTDAEISVSMRYTISPSSSVPINSFPHEGDHYYTFSDIEALANRIILSTYSSPHVIVDRNHRIVYFSSNTNPYLKHQTGKANLDIIQMAVGKLKLELRTALFQVMKDNKKYLKDSVTVKLKSGYRKIRIIIEPLVLSTKSNNSQEKYYLIVFDEFENVHAAGLDIDDDSISSENTKDQIILQMENELISTKEYLNKVINDYNVSIEELKASNEEILSMNEELQSTNEELQTSKEELQMLNDELTRVNSQLNGKINELTQSKNDINNLFSSTEIATIFLDNNLCIKRFTPATTEIFNFITEDIGRPIEHFSNKINYSTLMDDAREIIKSLSRIEREITAPGKRFFLVRLVPYRTDSNVIEGIVITFTDITKIKNYQSEIRKSEERLRTIFDHTVQSFILIDENGKIIAVNKVAHSMTMDIFGKEITEGEFITQYDILDNMPSDLLTFYKSALNGIENNTSISMQKTSDQLAYYNCSFSPVVDDNRAISGVLLVITDISEQKKWENELLKAKEIAELASKVKTQFLSNMSHEIRTPLNGILGMNSLLLKSTLSDDQMTYVRNIHVSGEILLSLINNILDLSKIESGQRTIKREVINFHKILDDVIKSFEECIKTKNLTLTCSVDSRIPDVLYGDALSITQIFNNLINNAYKFTETGTIDIYAKVKEITEDNLIIETTVSDTGIGISSENIEGIFERYTQIDCTYAKKFAGAGLGLSIVKSLVDLLKGNISVISEEGKGSNFTVILPFETADVSIPSKQSGVAMPSGVITPGLNILIVEDNAINQLALARTLKHYKCNVETASNGQDAQTILREKALDCVLMDIQMPVMDGIQCLKLLREGNTINRDVPVIALTGYAMAHDESNFLYIGFNSYITKPINENKLIMEIHRLARKH